MSLIQLDQSMYLYFLNTNNHPIHQYTQVHILHHLQLYK